MQAIWENLWGSPSHQGTRRTQHVQLLDDISRINCNNGNVQRTVRKHDVGNRKKRFLESKVLLWPKAVKLHALSGAFDTKSNHSNHDSDKNTKKS